VIQHAIAAAPPAPNASGIQHPTARPIFRRLPERLNGMPVLREIRDFAEEIPVARFHENEKPYLRPM